MSGRVELGLTRRTAILAGPMVSACLSRTRSKSWAVHITLGGSARSLGVWFKGCTTLRVLLP